MNHRNNKNKDTVIRQLVDRYERARQENRSVFLEEHQYTQLIDYYEEKMDLTTALEVAQLATERHGYSADFYIRKAQILLVLHREEEVMEVLDQAANFSPSDLEIALLRAEALVYLSQMNTAMNLLQPLKETAEQEELSNILLVEALIYEHRAEYDSMFYTLEASLEANPKNEEALQRIWLSSELSRRFSESVALHERLIDQNPYAHLAWFNLGHAHECLEQFEEAIEAYEYAFIIKDDFEDAYYDCAELCFELKRFNRAIQCYRDLEERFEADAELLLRTGQCYQQLDELETAARYFERALRLEPQNEEVLYHLGDNYCLREQWAQALRYYRMAIRLNDRQESFHIGAALAAQQLGDLEKAEHHFRSAVQLAAEQAHVWSPYAFFLVGEGRWSEAMDILTEAAKSCNDSELIYCRVACLFMANRNKEACQMLSQALSEDYDGHDLLLTWMPDLIDNPQVSALLYTYRP